MILNGADEGRGEWLELRKILTEVAPKRNESDGFVWPVDGTSDYSVRGYYNKLLQESTEEVVDTTEKEMLKVIWKSWMPSKVQVFGWRLMKERLATRDQLVKRGIIVTDEESLCVFGCLQLEDTNHVFSELYQN
ncbi:uncharacterized protein LOC131621635 [Vicia villosa]|uniref:uncharacterized protein LOC131621635 n=1 Tax=Vicia villosa TaxID=3911 RepID=UPI00273BEC75|nr:uncharacterized protein LOC131621635 [Vicia villosa]